MGNGGKAGLTQSTTAMNKEGARGQGQGSGKRAEEELRRKPHGLNLGATDQDVLYFGHQHCRAQIFLLHG